jgi:hypothetical protein
MKRSLMLLPVALTLVACGPSAQPGVSDPLGGMRRPGWTIQSKEHIDLWLHGWALLQQDTAHVPLFLRGYRDRTLAERRNSGITTDLDANMDRLSAHLLQNPGLVNAQFIPLYFANLDDMRRMLTGFVERQGRVSSGEDPRVAGFYNMLRSIFPTAADRDWLRIFTNSLVNEHERFYRNRWRAEQADRAPVVRQVEALWRGNGSRFERFLVNTQQANGELVLSLPLGGEGRTTTIGPGFNIVAVGFPADSTRAAEVLYVFAHEIVGGMVGSAIADQISPAEQRAGLGAQHQSSGAVRAGALLLERAAPDFLEGYMRYYIGVTGQTVTGDLRAAFERVFPLPEAIARGLAREMDIIYGGI